MQSACASGDVSSDCVYDSVCYGDGFVGDVDGDQSDEYCGNGVWIWEGF